MTVAEVRLVTAADAAAVVAHFDRHMAESGVGETPVFTPIPAGQPWHDETLAGQLQAFWQRPLSQPGWGRCWIVEAGADVVGALVLRGSSLPTGMHRATLAMGLEAPYRGRGLGRALMAASLAWADAQPDLRWIDLRVFAHNAPGRRLYAQCGFGEIGRVTDFIRVDGQVIDDILMARPTQGSSEPLFRP
jgi:RimJ/RimL family protein N-acetyltransferase